MMAAKTKLTLYVAILFTIVIISISMFGFFNFKSSSVENYANKLDSQSFLISKAVEQKMSRYFDTLNMVSAQLDVTQDGGLDVEKVVADTKRIQSKLKVLNSYIGMQDGTTYSAVRNGIIPNFNAIEKKREWYTRVFAGEKAIITTPYTSAAGNLVMALGVPVVRNGEVVAALCLNLAVDQITQFINDLSVENQIYTTRDDGFVLSSKNPKDIGKNLFRIIPSFASHKNAKSSAHEYEFQGEDYFVASSKLESLGWNVWAWDTQARINASSNDNLLSSSLIALTLIIVSLVVIYTLVIKLMYVPIGGEPKDIEKLLSKIAKGDLACTPNAKGTDTGVYAEILKMVDNLRAIVTSINASCGTGF